MKYQCMLASPAINIIAGPEWIVERKWDGMRAIFELSSTETLIFSRTGQDLCPQFPELLDLHERVGHECILDGEIVALIEPDQENLELLQMRLGDKLARRRDEIPVEVRFFDMLELMGKDIRQAQLSDRRMLMEEVFLGSEFNAPEMSWFGSIPTHWEGVVSKLLTSPYESGKRRRSWSKWKRVNRATLQATGLTPGKGARAGSFGAILVSDANGVHRGQVGSGFTKASLDAVMSYFHPLPFNANHSPLLIEVEYRFISKTGLMVNTAFKGIRDDKTEADAL